MNWFTIVTKHSIFTMVIGRRCMWLCFIYQQYCWFRRIICSFRRDRLCSLFGVDFSRDKANCLVQILGIDVFYDVFRVDRTANNFNLRRRQTRASNNTPCSYEQHRFPFVFVMILVDVHSGFRSGQIYILYFYSLTLFVSKRTRSNNADVPYFWSCVGQSAKKKNVIRPCGAIRVFWRVRHSGIVCLDFTAYIEHVRMFASGKRMVHAALRTIVVYDEHVNIGRRGRGFRRFIIRSGRSVAPARTNGEWKGNATASFARLLFRSPTRARAHNTIGRCVRERIRDGFR